MLSASTKPSAALVMTDAVVDAVAAGVSVTGPPVWATVIVNPGKSARPVKVFEVDVFVCKTPFLV